MFSIKFVIHKDGGWFWRPYAWKSTKCPHQRGLMWGWFIIVVETQ